MAEQTLSIKIVINADTGAISTVATEFDELNSKLGTVKTGLNETSNALDKTASSSKAAHESSDGFMSMIGQTAVYSAAYEGLSAIADGFKALTYGSLQVASNFENLNLGIGTLIANNLDTTDSFGKTRTAADRYAEGMKLSTDVMAQLKEANKETPATLSQITTAFQSAVAPATQMGMSLSQTVQYTKDMTLAAGALGMPMDQLAQEMRAVFEGDTSKNSRINSLLQIKEETIQAHAAAGDLGEFLLQQLEVFRLAGKDSQNTWSGLTSNISDAFDEIRNKAINDVFIKLKGDGKDLLDYLETNGPQIAAQLSDAFMSIYDAGKVAFETIKEKVDIVLPALELIVEHATDILNLFLGYTAGKLAFEALTFAVGAYEMAMGTATVATGGLALALDALKAHPVILILSTLIGAGIWVKQNLAEMDTQYAKWDEQAKKRAEEMAAGPTRVQQLESQLNAFSGAYNAAVVNGLDASAAELKAKLLAANTEMEKLNPSAVQQKPNFKKPPKDPKAVKAESAAAKKEQELQKQWNAEQIKMAKNLSLEQADALAKPYIDLDAQYQAQEEKYAGHSDILAQIDQNYNAQVAALNDKTLKKYDETQLKEQAAAKKKQYENSNIDKWYYDQTAMLEETHAQEVLAISQNENNTQTALRTDQNDTNSAYYIDAIRMAKDYTDGVGSYIVDEKNSLVLNRGLQTDANTDYFTKTINAAISASDTEINLGGAGVTYNSSQNDAKAKADAAYYASLGAYQTKREEDYAKALTNYEQLDAKTREQTLKQAATYYESVGNYEAAWQYKAVDLEQKYTAGAALEVSNRLNYAKNEFISKGGSADNWAFKASSLEAQYTTEAKDGAAKRLDGDRVEFLGKNNSLTSFGDAFTYATNNLTKTWTNSNVSLASGFANVLSGMQTSMSSGFVDLMNGKINSVGGFFSKTFDGIKQSFFKMVADIASKQIVMGFINAWNGNPNTGRGPIESMLGLDIPFLHFAQGTIWGSGGNYGVVDNKRVGYDSLANDKIPALISPGEAVIPASAVAANWDLVNALILGARGERFAGGYINSSQFGGDGVARLGWGGIDLGGIIGGITGGISSAVSGIGSFFSDAWRGLSSIGSGFGSALSSIAGQIMPVLGPLMKEKWIGWALQAALALNPGTAWLIPAMLTADLVSAGVSTATGQDLGSALGSAGWSGAIAGATAGIGGLISGVPVSDMSAMQYLQNYPAEMADKLLEKYDLVSGFVHTLANPYEFADPALFSSVTDFSSYASHLGPHYTEGLAQFQAAINPTAYTSWAQSAAANAYANFGSDTFSNATQFGNGNGFLSYSGAYGSNQWGLPSYQDLLKPATNYTMQSAGDYLLKGMDSVKGLAGETLDFMSNPEKIASYVLNHVMDIVSHIM